MNSREILYLDVSQITEVHKKDIFLKDIAKVYCKDPAVREKCGQIQVLTAADGENRRYVENVLGIIEKIHQIYPELQVVNLGEVSYIVDHHGKKKENVWMQRAKTAAVCVISFFGAGFAIMTFNNDVSVTDVFQEIYLLVTGRKSSGFTVLEVSYSIGLFLGIVRFFNHFSKQKINTDPTPLEVEMRLYEENVNKALIDNEGRKETDIDVT